MAIKGDLAQIYAGWPVKVNNCNIAVSQPSVKDICAFGEDNFLMGVQIFTGIERTVSPIKEGNSRLAMLEDFQVLMVILNEDDNLKRDMLEFFKLIFPEYNVRFDPGCISFLIGDNKRIVGQINPMNFEEFKNTLQTLFLPKGSESAQDYNPANDAAARIAEKLKRGNQTRQQLALEEDKGTGSLFTNYVSILSVGMNISLESLFNYTPFQLYDTFIRYSKKIAFDLYQKIATTPMMDVSKMKEPDNWMDNLY